MTISYNWLHEYLPEIIDANELSNILTSVGLEVESMEKLESVKGGLEGLVIGKVMECTQHPNADKLKLTKVDIGADNYLNIVCGAPNVAVGQTVVIATIGTTIYPTSGEPITMKKAKIRGEESEGMICAEDELGLGKSHDGIIVLQDGIKVGTLAKDFYQLPATDIIYEIGLTPNRMDAMSHLGVAKDVCAYLSNAKGIQYDVKTPSVKSISANENSKSNVEIIIENENLCSRYSSICIENIKIGESPDWMQTKLKAIGLKPINNIVDITNFVMHECGHPLHAFDLEKIEGNKIVVKTIKDKAKFIALDSKEIELCNEDLMICNENNPMCIAGVYGGLDSGVSENTKSIFLESAWFLPDSIRKTSMRLGLRTDAAVRFEKGADISNVPYALQRATDLIVEIVGGKVMCDIMDVYPKKIEKQKIDLNLNKIRSVAGKEYTNQQIKNILTSLNFGIESESVNSFLVSVPFAKTDITMQADVLEEIMRIDGLDNIPFTGTISYSLPNETKAYQANAKQNVVMQLVSKGFYELFTNSITNAAYYSNQEGLVKMMNSLSANLDTMRPSMLESGLEAISYNLNRKNDHLKFFEFGRVYSRKENEFSEVEHLCLYLSGNYQLPHWTEKAKTVDIYYARGVVESLFTSLKFTFVVNENGLDILFQNKKIGSIQDIAKDKLKQFDIKQAVWFVEMNWVILKSALENYKVKYSEIPKFPFVQRDLAMVVDKQIRYQEIESAVKQAKSKLLQGIKLFDVFESDKLGVGKVSYAINLSFYDNQKTLTDIEVESEMKQIVHQLEKKVGAVVRA